MDPSIILQNLLTAPILFFVLGLLATWLRSDLSIPQPIAKFMSLYLLFAIGLHGGVELAKTGLDLQVMLVLAVAAATSFAFPVVTFFILRARLDAANAAVIAACYGSISAVTFVTAISFLESQQIEYSGYMVAAMALMESPAIIAAVLLYRHFDKPPAPDASDTGASDAPASDDATDRSAPMGWVEIMREAFLNGAVVILLGSLLIGMLAGPDDWVKIKPFAHAPFTGVLCLFLLDMGMLAAKRFSAIFASGLSLLAFSILGALAQGFVGLLLAAALNLQPGNALLFAILCGSASYIAVPAAARLAIPQANPSIYVPMSLAVTFPFNIAVGIPLYMSIIDYFWQA